MSAKKLAGKGGRGGGRERQEREQKKIWRKNLLKTFFKCGYLPCICPRLGGKRFRVWRGEVVCNWVAAKNIWLTSAIISLFPSVRTMLRWRRRDSSVTSAASFRREEAVKKHRLRLHLCALGALRLHVEFSVHCDVRGVRGADKDCLTALADIAVIEVSAFSRVNDEFCTIHAWNELSVCLLSVQKIPVPPSALWHDPGVKAALCVHMQLAD